MKKKQNRRKFSNEHCKVRRKHQRRWKLASQLEAYGETTVSETLFNLNKYGYEYEYEDRYKYKYYSKIDEDYNNNYAIG